MEWHAGSALSQTVFTLLFVHELENFDPDLLTPDSSSHRDPRRPRELITVVLRAFVSGLLKCCDLAWRDMSKGLVNDVRMLTSSAFFIKLSLLNWPLYSARIG
jgi:hypothetical protein